MTTTLDRSLARMLHRAEQLGLRVAYATITPHGTFFDARMGLTEQEEDLAFRWADGHVRNRYVRLATGQCSIQAMVEFDLAEFEVQVRRDITALRQILRKYGEPTTLTPEQMRARGYIYGETAK